MNPLVVTYALRTEDPRGLADAIRVEQSIEFPKELAPAWIQSDVVGQIEKIGPSMDGVTEVQISFNPENTGFELPQLLNVLWGNASILPGVRVIDVTFPDSIIERFKGPRFGLAGLREMFNAPARPLASTALKPMGSSTKQFADMAYTIAKAGFDTIKDDHSLANQPWSTWRERVEAVAAAVEKANSETGSRCIYAPSLNLPANEMLDAAREAKQLGASSLLLLPGISGFDVMRAIAEDDELALPIMGHPAFLGSFVTSPQQGISHGVLFGKLMRIAGADIAIFPNFGGRFSFTQEQCAEIRFAAQEKIGHIRPSWISPAGGMQLDRIDSMIGFYGKDTASLIGGALHDGDLLTNATAMVEKIHSHS